MSCPPWWYCQCWSWGWRGAWEPLTSFVLYHCSSSGCPSGMLHRRSEEQLCITVWREASRNQLLWCPWKTNNKTGYFVQQGYKLFMYWVLVFVRIRQCLLLYLLTVFIFRWELDNNSTVKPQLDYIFENIILHWLILLFKVMLSQVNFTLLYFSSQSEASTLPRKLILASWICGLILSVPVQSS